MMKMKIALYFSIFFMVLSGYSQQEAANWYFGDRAGLTFNTGSPIALTNGELNQLEGCASISTSNGVLLFYTNGVVIYNANHQIMANGSGLLGSDSSTQSAIIIKQPLHTDRYYVFTTAAEGNSNGMAYSVVDMSLNGGLGDVLPAEKNIHLDGPMTEKLTAVYHENQQDIWVLSHRLNSDIFVGYLVTAAGISSSPVLSAAGKVNVGGTTGPTLGIGALGYLKASPDGRKLASAVTYISPGLELFDFNTATGIVSNAVEINNYGTYGVEFSPDSKNLYCSTKFALVAGKLYQYDLSSGTQAGIVASETVISNVLKYGALQLGIDGKIYVSENGSMSFVYDHLSVIKSPNTYGAGCNFVEDAVSLSGRASHLGLPPFIQSFFQFNLNFDVPCYGQATKMKIVTHSNLASVNWNFGDPASGADNTSTQIQPDHIFSTAGTYTVTATVQTVTGYSVTLSDSYTILPSPIAHFPGNINICDDPTNDGIEHVMLNGQTAAILESQNPADYIVTYYTTEADAIDGITPLPSTATYPITITQQTFYARLSNNSTGCFSVVSFTAQVYEMPNITIASNPDFVGCAAAGQEYIFDLTSHQQRWMVGQDLSHFTFSYFTSVEDAIIENAPIANPTAFPFSGGALYVRVSNKLHPECFTIESFQLLVSIPPIVTNDSVYYVCETDSDNTEVIQLSSLSDFILNSVSQSGLSITYFNSINDADTQTAAIMAAGITVSGARNLVARVTNGSSCFKIVPLTIMLGHAPFAVAPQPYALCESLGTNGLPDNDGFQHFNLHSLDNEILAGQSPLNYTVTYYQNIPDASLPINAIPINEANAYQSETATIYARVTDNITGCINANPIPVSLTVEPLPSVVLTQSELCIHGGSSAYIGTDLGSGFVYLWNTGATSPTIEVTLPGNYYVTVTNNNTNNHCSYTSNTVSIYEASAPDANPTVIQSELFSGDNTIEVIATGSGVSAYDYQLDNGPIMDVGFFSNIEPGLHTVRIIETHGCGKLTITIKVIDYMKFFTPNGDGINDFWNIYGMESYPTSMITIFDRYGKVLTRINPRSIGWDGSYHGKALPSDDYWFKLEYSDPSSGSPIEFRAHFAMKR